MLGLGALGHAVGPSGAIAGGCCFAVLLLLIGLFFGLANFLFTWSLMVGSVVRSMLLFFLLPAWGAIGGRLFLNEKLGPRRLLAVALCLGGTPLQTHSCVGVAGAVIASFRLNR